MTRNRVVPSTFRRVAPLLCLLGAACSRQPSESAAPQSSSLSSPAPIPAIVAASRPSKPVIVVGLDGADWQLLDRYMAGGSMPNLQRLVAEGSSGMLETIHPPLSPLIWTTMMTGMSPLQHHILDFVRFNPGSGQKEPITSDERRTPAIWNMASWGGRRVGVFGLWATYPAEAVNGLIVSDRLFTFLFKETEPPEGVVFPRNQEPWARAVVDRAARAVTFAELKTYLPWLTNAEYEAALKADDPYAHPVSALRRTLVETRLYDTLAREWIERSRPDLAIVYFQGTDSIGHTFAPFAPPRQPAIDAADYEKYRAVPGRYFAEVDTLLGRYRRIAEQQGATLVVVSDHGFAWGEDRPTQLSSNAQATAAKWHHKQGIYLLWGPGITAHAREQASAGTVTQVCSTLLALSGLPANDRDKATPLPGTPAGVGRSVNYQAQYRPARAAKVTSATRAADEETLQKLRSLGYLGSGESRTGNRTVEATRSAGSYNNEGLLLKAEGRKADAIAAFENALVVDPNLASALWNLSDLLFENPGSLDRSDALLVGAFGAGLPEGPKFLIGRAIGYQRAGQVARSVKLLEEAVKARPEEIELWLFLGRYHVEAGECPAAVRDFERATRLAPRNAGAFASLGLARACTGDRVAARRELERSLELDPTQMPVRAYLRKLGG
jgi:tetratricopeptide (TPR) repeat protein